MENPINSNVFDSRDLIEYRNELVNELPENWEEQAENWVVPEEIEHYQAINGFCEELENHCPDLLHGATVIHEDYFMEYCQDLLDDCGNIPKNFPTWIEIDWNKTTENMKVDYSGVEYNGETYYIR